MELNFSSDKINYYGRTDMKEDGAYFYFPSSSAEVRFRGTEISARINANIVWGTLFLGYIIDGRMGKIPLCRDNNGKDVTYQLANSLEPDREHTLILYKMHAGNLSYSLKGFSCSGEFLPPPEKPSLKLEFYGDSVSAGEVTEAYDFVGRSDPASHDSAYDNSYLSYTWQTARLLGAQFNNISQGGIAVFDKTGYFHGPDTIGMESVYDKLCYFPEGGEITSWDFSLYTPDIAVFALGQNDEHDSVKNTTDIDIHDPDVRKKWKDGYKNIVKGIFAHYGSKTKYVFLTTLLMHDPDRDTAIDEMVSELKTEGIPAYHFLFKRNGAATPGHPRYQEHKEMAEELAAYLKEILS